MSVEHVRPGPDGDVRLDLEQRFASRTVVQDIISKMPPAASPSNLLADRQWVRDHASQAVKDKADKVSGATAGDFAGLDGSGNLTDSGKKPSDYELESGPSGKVSDPWTCTPAATQYGTPFSVKWTTDPAEGEGWALFAGGTKQGKVLGDEGSTELSWSPAAQTSGYTVSAARQLSGTEYHLKGQPDMKLQPAGDYASGRQGARADSAVQPPDLLGFVDGAAYDAVYGNPPKPTILLKHGTTVVATVDATAFVIDGMVEDVRIEGGNLVIVFNTAAGGREIDIPLTDIFDPANYYDKDAVDGKLDEKRDKTDLNVYPPVYSDWVIVVGGAALTDGHRLAWRSDVNVWQVYDKNGLGAGMSSTSTEDALSCSGFITGVSAGSTFTATRSRSSDTLVKASQIPPATVGKIVYATCHTDQSNANKVAMTAAGGFIPTTGAVVCVHFDRFPSGESTLSVDDSDAYPIWLRLFADGNGLRAGESSWGNNDNVLVLFLGDKWLMLGAVPATPDEYGTVRLKHSLDDNDSRATVNQPTLKAAFDRKLDATEGDLNALGYVYLDWDMSAFPATFQSSQPQTYYNDVVNKYEWVILTGGVVVSDEKYDTEADALAALSITLRGPQLPNGAVATRTRTATSYRLGTAGGQNADKPLQPAGDYATKVSPATAGNLASLTSDGGIADSGKSLDDVRRYTDNEVVKASKPTHVYNAGASDRTDDKGGLATVDPGQSTPAVYTINGNAFEYYKFQFYQSSVQRHMFKKWPNNYITYDPNSGLVTNLDDYDGGWHEVELATIEAGLDPRVSGLRMPDLDGVTVHGCGTGRLAYTPKEAAFAAPYAHFALEEAPTRAIAASTAYAAGDLLGDGGKAYRCISAYTSAAAPVAPSSDTTHWAEVPVLKAGLNSSATGFAEFDAERDYAIGATVTYKGHAYICKDPHLHSEWNPAHFDEMPVVVSRTAASGGVAVGADAEATNDATAAGRGAKATDIGAVAVGVAAVSSEEKGVAVGPDAKVYAQHGTAVGHGAEVSAEKGTAIGYNAKVAAGKTGAVQLGAGTNQQAYSLQFRGTTVVDTNGKIPAANLDKAIPSLAGETMPETPTQNELTAAVKKIFGALGGIIQQPGG